MIPRRLTRELRAARAYWREAAAPGFAVVPAVAGPALPATVEVTSVVTVSCGFGAPATE